MFITISLSLYAIYYPNFHTSKKLNYRFISFDKPINKDSALKNELKIVYQGKELDNLYSVLMEFQNAGSTAIASQDFETALTINFDSLSKIVNVNIARTIPEKIPVLLNHNDSTIIIKPLLLNVNDKFLLQIFLTGDLELPSINGRIIGVNQISEVKEYSVQYKKNSFLIWLDGISGFLLVILSAMLIAIYFFENRTIAFRNGEFIICYFILFNGGAALVANWGQDVNFMIPKWLTIVLAFSIIPLVGWIFYKFRAKKRLS